MSELDGFVLLKPHCKSHPISLNIAPAHMYTSISRGALAELGCPTYCNIFVDENKKRVMIKAAEEGYQNTYHLVQNKKKRTARINNKNLAVTLGKLFTGTVIPGHVAGDGIVIFQEEK